MTVLTSSVLIMGAVFIVLFIGCLGQFLGRNNTEEPWSLYDTTEDAGEDQ